MKKLVLFLLLSFSMIACESGVSSWIYEPFQPDNDIIPVYSNDYNGDFTFLDLNKGQIAANASYYEDHVSYFYDGISYLSDDNGDYFFVDKHFKPINDCKYKEVTIFSEGLAWAVKEFGKITAINKNGEEVFSLDDVEEVYPYREGVAVFVGSNGKYGVLDKSGKTIVEPSFDDLTHFAYHGLLEAVVDGKHGIVDVKGKMRVPCEYSYTTFGMNTGLIGYVGVCYEDDHWGVVDLNNKPLPVEGKYDYIVAEPGGRLLYSKRYCGWIDKKGKTIIPEKFNIVCSDVNEGLFRNNDVAYVIEGRDTYSIIDTKGNVIYSFPVVDRSKCFFDENGLLCIKTSFWGAVNAKGKTIIQHNYSDDLFHLGGKVYVGDRPGAIDVLNETGKVLKEIRGEYTLYVESYPETSVHNRYVDINQITSDLSQILAENKFDRWTTPVQIMERYNIDELSYTTSLKTGMGSGYEYDLIVNMKNDSYNGVSYPVRYKLDIDLVGAAARNYETREAVYDAIEEYFTDKESGEIVVPGYEDYETTLRSGDFTFSVENTGWIYGVWQANLGDGYAFLSIDSHMKTIIIDDLDYDNSGTTIPYTYENQTIKPQGSSESYLLDFDKETIYYNGDVEMKKVSNKPWSQSHPYTPYSE